MKEFSFYLFFLYLFFKVKSLELEYEINKKDETNDITINYIDIDGKNFLLNPRSEKIVLFRNSTNFKTLQSDINEIDYFDILELNLKEVGTLDINIDKKTIHLNNVYLIDNIQDPFKNMDGYIGIKNGANFIKTLDLKKKHGYKQKVNNNNEKFYLGKEVKIDDDYNDDSNFVSIEPALDDDDELSLSLSQFTFKSISKIKDKYQYEIDKENGNYIDSKNKVFISLFLSNYHIAPIDWIEKVLKECGLIKDVDYTESIDVVNYLNIKLTKFDIKNDAKMKENFNFIFDSSTAIKIELFDKKKKTYIFRL